MAKKEYLDLLDSTYACVIINNDQVIYGLDHFGVIPILKYLKQATGVEIEVYDRLIGKGAALLLLLQPVKYVYAKVITTEAYELLKSHQVEVEYGEMIEHILNRTLTDLCPIEKIAASIDDSKQIQKELLAFYQSINIEI